MKKPIPIVLPFTSRNGGPHNNNGKEFHRWIPWRVDTRYSIYDTKTKRWSDELFNSLSQCTSAIRGMEHYYGKDGPE